MFKNSEIDLKRDLRGRLADLVDEEAAVRAVGRLEGFGASLQAVGLVNDPAVPAGIQRGRAVVLTVDELRVDGELCIDIAAMFEYMERASHRRPDVLVTPFGRGSAKSPLMLRHLIEEMDERSRQAFPWDEESPHPGERHRQVTRQVKSSRSRAGKAGRWS